MIQKWAVLKHRINTESRNIPLPVSGLRLRRKLNVILAGLFGGAVGAFQLGFWNRALEVAGHAVLWRGEPFWTSGGPGSFLPWSREPGMLAVMTPMTNPFDQFIFHLIQTRMFVPLALCLAVLAGVVGWFLGDHFAREA